MKANRKTSGQSLVEFMLIIPIFVFAITVFMDLSRAVYIYSALSNAVREGARYAAVHELNTSAEQDQVKQVVKDKAVGLDPGQINITLSLPVSPAYAVTVHATYSFFAATPGLERLICSCGAIPLNAESSMEVAPIFQ